MPSALKLLPVLIEATLMGNFHCIPERCGRVVYREYLPPVVRWRYPGSDWQQIEGDDYSIDELPAQCCGSWDLTVEYYVPGCNGVRAYSGTTTKRIPDGRFRRLEYTLDNPFVRSSIQIVYWDCNQKKEKTLSVWGSSGKSSVIANCGDPTAIHDLAGSTYQVVNAVRIGGSDLGCTECTLTVYKNQEVVQNETREECPEVEVLPCRLSDEVKEIKIEKEAYLQRIEVRNQSIDVNYVSPLDAPIINTSQLPTECLNIYKTLTLSPPNLSEYVPVPGVINPYQFIQQICSAPGCPAPEYQVICDCECESCPDGTCPVDCGAHICCYEASGVAVKSIPLENYCDKSE